MSTCCTQAILQVQSNIMAGIVIKVTTFILERVLEVVRNDKRHAIESFLSLPHERRPLCDPSIALSEHVLHGAHQNTRFGQQISSRAPSW